MLSKLKGTMNEVKQKANTVVNKAEKVYQSKIKPTI